MRFRTKTRPRGLLRPGDQKRLSLLIVGFGVIMVCFSVVRRPEFWKGMFPDSAELSPPATQPLLSGDGAVPAASVLHPDEFFVDSSASSDEVVSVTAKRVTYDQTMAEQETEASNSIPRIPADLLRDVRDDVIGVHSTESKAYFAALTMALKAESRKFDKPAGNGAYALFMDSPNSSRGIAWNIEGRLRRISVVRSQANPFGVGALPLYDAWISTPDSGNQLVHAVARQAEGPLANLISKTTPNATREFSHEEAPPVRLVGYFFKIEGYLSNNEISRAPLLLAGTLRDVPPPPTSSNRADELTPYLGYLALIICAGVSIMLWDFAMKDDAHAQTRTHQLTKLPAVVNFEDVTSMSVMESLNELEFANSQTDNSPGHLN